MSKEAVFDIENGVLTGGSFYGVTCVEIPAGVTAITAPIGKRSGGVFEGSRELETVVIPEGVTEIGERTFCRCTALKEIRLPDSLKKIGSGAFRGCTALKEITIPEGVEAIEDDTFGGCTALTTIRLPLTLKTIGGAAFSDCKLLERIDLPAGLQTIGRRAFFKCSALKQLGGLSDAVDVSVDGTFIYCPALADESGFVIVNHTLYGYFGTGTDVKIPQGVTNISEMAFDGRADLTAVSIPAGVKTIGWRAFGGCTGLTSVALPDGVESVEGFENCTGLVSINFPDSVKKIRSFNGCTSLKAVHLPDGIEEIIFRTFSGCTALTQVHLGAGLKKIGNDAFSECTALEEIHIPDGVQYIEGFASCSNLKKINLPPSLRIANGAGFDGCKKIPYLTIPSGANSSWMAFPKEILLVLPDTFEDIAQAEKSSFNNGSSLLVSAADYRIVLNDKFVKLKALGKDGLNRKIYDSVLAANECKLPSHLVTFAMLCRLRWNQELAEDKKALYIENVVKNIKKIAPYVNMNPDDGLIATLEETGALTAKNKKTLLPLMGIGEAPAPKAKKEEKVAAADGTKTPAQLKKEWSTKKLEDGTLRLSSYKGSDTVVEVPAMIGKDAVTVIGSECMSCSRWSKASAEQIANRKKITRVIIPEGITEIGEDAFCECESLESVTLPNSLKVIRSKAFFRCAGLKHLTVSAGTDMENAAFAGCNALADEQGLIIVNNMLFRGTRGGDIVIPATVTKIDENTFNGLHDLKSIVFPEGLKALPNRVVKGCYSLQSVTIPPSVTDIGRDPFPDWTKLTVCGYSGSAAEQLSKINPKKFEFRSIGVLEREETDFEITDGVLTRYNGNEKHVTIPDGVCRIGGFNGGNWRKTGAFEGNKTVEKITIPDTVTAITDNAFYNCTRLREIEIPDSVVTACKSEFEFTPWLQEQMGKAVYAGRVLIRFDGASYEEVVKQGVRDELIVRPGTVAIANSACWNTASLIKVVLPDTVTRIEAQAFGCCENLQEMVVPAGITELGDSAFEMNAALKHCSGGVLHKNTKLPAKFKYFYTGDVTDTAWLALYQSDKSWSKILREKLDAAPENISPVIAKMAELVNAMPALDKNVGNRAGAFAQELCKGADGNALKSLYRALKEKNHPIVQKLDEDAGFKACMEGGVQEDLSALHPVEALAAQNIKHTPAFEKVLGRIVEGVPYGGTEEVCAPRVLAFIAYEYIRQYDPESVKHVSVYETACTAYGFSAAADEAAASLDAQKLQNALLQLAEQYEGEYWLPYARYADDQHTVRLLSKMREWDTWWKYGATGRKHIIIARSGLLLNDTKAAMLHLDQAGRLELYAQLRNTDAETIRDTVLSDFGFDEKREIRYDLGANAVIISMDDDLNLTIFDTNAGKIVKSIPRKGADAARYEQAKTALSDLKKNIKKVITNRKHLLFGDFLSGEKKPAEKWKQSYLGNPVLNSVARLVVWMQEGKTFTLTKDGAVDSTGSAYAITGAPVAVAHPMEMRGEIAAWQSYFTSRGLKQPFEQVWEPAYDPSAIREDRYTGSILNVYRLTNKEQHGIHVWGLTSYSENYGFNLTDCTMEHTASAVRFIPGMTDDAQFELGKFTFKTFNRRVNHIVYLFDKWTVTDRLLKDDVTVEPLLEAFTPAQIREFIHLTTEKGCVNCSAMLLNYQSAHFDDLDPLAEFTLDL